VSGWPLLLHNDGDSENSDELPPDPLLLPDMA